VGTLSTLRFTYESSRYYRSRLNCNSFFGSPPGIRTRVVPAYLTSLQSL